MSGATRPGWAIPFRAAFVLLTLVVCALSLIKYARSGHLWEPEKKHS